MEKTICFTGRRPKSLCGYNINAYYNFSRQLLEIIRKLYKKGYKTFITGGAQGFDQLAFYAIDKLREQENDDSITHNLYLPFFHYGTKWKKEGLFGKDSLEFIKIRSNYIKYVADNPINKTDAIIAMNQRNHAMVNDSSLVIALVPENDELTKGGTAECIRYAEKNNKEILRLFYKVENSELKIVRTEKNKV